MATYAPSIYEYETDQEWEQAAREWADENEPRYFVLYKDDSGQYVRKPFESRDEAIAFIGMDSANKTLVARVANKFCDKPVFYRPEYPDGDGKPSRWPSGTLPGGTREEYRALGLTRF